MPSESPAPTADQTTARTSSATQLLSGHRSSRSTAGTGPLTLRHRNHDRDTSTLGHNKRRLAKLLPPLVVVIMTVCAISGVWLLVGRASESRVAELQVSSLRLLQADLQSAPFDADPSSGGSPSATLVAIRTDESLMRRGLTARSQVGVASSLLSAARSDLGSIEPLIASVYRLAVGNGGLIGAGARVPKLNGQLVVQGARLSAVFAKISRADGARAATARIQTKLGAAGAMLLLLAAFAYFYFRSMAAHEAVERLACEKGEEARTDALTDLGNRRALADDLAGALEHRRGAGELLLVMFDLDGFKQYNDTFGHPAGDALLNRLGGRLAAAIGQSDTAYRMGGDEFCVLTRCGPADAERLLNDTISALEESGEGWHIGCSHGGVWIPSEATTEILALKLADERLYANKASRASTSRQVTDALLQVLAEQDGALDDHVERVSQLAGALAVEVGLSEPEAQRCTLAAKLHDIGKTAIPAAILDKPGPLDESEWEFMRRHPEIGERIVSTAPALAHTADLIRSSHERFDGHGYPDQLEGENIPLGSRIIAVCDAFEAMTSDRLYRKGIGIDAALEELKRHAGTQFDPAIVEAFCNNSAMHPFESAA
jgi:diguanylate cyclase (GGDEF)-like protein